LSKTIGETGQITRAGQGLICFSDTIHATLSWSGLGDGRASRTLGRELEDIGRGIPLAGSSLEGRGGGGSDGIAGLAHRGTQRGSTEVDLIMVLRGGRVLSAQLGESLGIEAFV